MLAGLACLGAVPDNVAIAVGGGRCVVPVTLDGGVAQMVIDTGAERTTLAENALRRLGLRLDPYVESTMRGAGGVIETHADADVGAGFLAGIALVQRRPGRLSLAVAREADFQGADGLLGGDVLRHLPDFSLNFQVQRLVFGALEGGVALAPLNDDLLLVPVTLDGVSITALVDTGASVSLINARGNFKLGPLDVQGDAGNVGAVGGSVGVRRRRFAGLWIGTQSVEQPVLAIAPVPEMAFDMILGLDVLGQFSGIGISYAQHRLLLTP